MARGKLNKRGRGSSGGGRGRGRGGRGGGGGGQRNFPDNRVSFDQVNKHNERFELFYNTINIVPAGEEREKFWAALRRELPNSFRFTGSKGHARRVRNNLVDRFFPLIKQIEHDGRPVELPKQMSWYPEGLAYSMTTPKNIVRKYEPFKDFQKFLVSETSVGNISRQEEVSMIPPMVLDIQPHHKVLDLCAAPGSKSAQLIELIHAGEEERVHHAIEKSKSATDGESLSEISPESGRATGLLVANDVNYDRAKMLVHQLKRLNSPNLVVTNHDATMFPSIKLSSGKYLKFDRILADVPCSGDGTTRKNPNIWKDWTPQNGLGLYATQVKILKRALQMLRPGGRVVYSTCSLNPVENEAVVASAIECCGGVAKVKLLNCDDQLPGLRRSAGLKDWSIMSRSGQIYESWAEARQFENPESRIVPGMFPPELEEQIPMENCIRVYPHQQDTGGFFVAVLEKISELRGKPDNESKFGNKDWTFTAPDVEPAPSLKRRAPDEEEEPTSPKKPKVAEPSLEPTAPADHNDGTTNPDAIAADAPFQSSVPLEIVDRPAAAKKKRGEPATDEAFEYLSPTHEELLSIYKFYALHSSFPRDRFLVRNPKGDPVKGIYYSSDLAKDILQSNKNTGMKFVHGGVKMFMKQDAQGQDTCRWRIQSEGLPLVQGWVGEERVVRLTKKSTLRKLLVEMFPKVSTYHLENGEEKHGWEELGEIGEQVRDISMGCCVLRVEVSPGATDDEFDEPLTLPLWRSLHSLNLMLPKEDRTAMLRRYWEGEPPELINHGNVKQHNADDKAPASQKNGSRPAEDDAKELQEKLANADDDVEGNDAYAAVEATRAHLNGADQETLQGEAMAMEQDAVAAADRIESVRLEVLEDENRKITEAMPERDGEGDSCNTTV